VDLLVSQLKAAIRALLEAKRIRARVLDKINRHGEIVIGIILDREPPPPEPPPVETPPSADS
jgi:hypothetical protein